jgi:hypothetical protein
MRTKAILLLLALTVIPGAGRAGVVTQDACGGTVSMQTFASVQGSVFENLAFVSDGSVWVSDQSANAVRRYAPDGSALPNALAASAPGGILQVGDDVYVNYGDSASGAEQRSHAAGILRKDLTTGAVSTFASGLNMANGLTRDVEGNFYVSNDFDTGLTKISPAGVPTRLNDTWGTNGLVMLGDLLWSNITFDGRSPIDAFDPASGTLVKQIRLSASIASLQPAVYPDGADVSKPLVGLKGLDDITTDGAFLYPVANGMGELLRVDPADGDACLIVDGLQNPSSVRIAPPAFSVPGATTTFFVTGFDGTLRRIAWTH